MDLGFQPRTASCWCSARHGARRYWRQLGCARRKRTLATMNGTYAPEHTRRSLRAHVTNDKLCATNER